MGTITGYKAAGNELSPAPTAYPPAPTAPTAYPPATPDWSNAPAGTTHAYLIGVGYEWLQNNVMGAWYRWSPVELKWVKLTEAPTSAQELIVKPAPGFKSAPEGYHEHKPGELHPDGDVRVEVILAKGKQLTKLASELSWDADLPEGNSIAYWRYDGMIVPVDDESKIVTPEKSSTKQPRYTDSNGEDWIDECAREFTTEEFRGAMKFTIGKYHRRLGKKDELVEELTKISDYCNRWIEYETE